MIDNTSTHPRYENYHRRAARQVAFACLCLKAISQDDVFDHDAVVTHTATTKRNL
jgi:hypothetical protein